MPPIWSRSMKPAFRDIAPEGPRVAVTLDGQALMLRAGGNLAAELLAAGVAVFRQTPVSAAPRAPFCMMGACYDCLLGIEGEARRAGMGDVPGGRALPRPGPGVMND